MHEEPTAAIIQSCLDALPGGVAAGLLTALRPVRPATVRQFFALANRRLRWQLNDLARRLDERPAAAALAEPGRRPRKATPVPLEEDA